MAIKKEKKGELIKKYRKDDKDTGSAPVQIAIFSARIGQITEHLKSHQKDKHSRLGLIKLVSKRKKLLGYLKRVNSEAYQKVVKELEIRI